jgi:hypothetical protein
VLYEGLLTKRFTVTTQGIQPVQGKKYFLVFSPMEVQETQNHPVFVILCNEPFVCEDLL